MKDCAAFDHDSGEGATIGCPAVDVQTVSVQDGPVDRGMAMDNQRAMRLRIIQKRPSYPKEVCFGLLTKRDTRADTGMNDQGLATQVRGGQAVKEGAVMRRHSRHRLGMDESKGAVGRIAHPVGGQRHRPTKFRMQPTQIGTKAWIMEVDVGKKAREHPVMIAFEHDPVLAARYAQDQMLDHPGAVRPPVHQIANMDDRASAVAGHIVCNAVMRSLHKVKMPVNIANGVDVHWIAPDHATSNCSAFT